MVYRLCALITHQFPCSICVGCYAVNNIVKASVSTHFDQHRPRRPHRIFPCVISDGGDVRSFQLSDPFDPVPTWLCKQQSCELAFVPHCMWGLFIGKKMRSIVASWLNIWDGDVKRIRVWFQLLYTAKLWNRIHLWRWLQVLVLIGEWLWGDLCPKKKFVLY